MAHFHYQPAVARRLGANHQGKHVSSETKSYFTRREDQGFSIVYVLTAFLIVVAGTATLLNQSTSAMLGSIFQGQSWQARNVARSGMAYLISQINKEENRHLLVLPNSLKAINPNADKVPWSDIQASAKHSNPCTTTYTNREVRRTSPRLTDINLGESQANNGFFYINNNGFISKNRNGSTGAFRILNRPNSNDFKIPVKSSSVFSLLDDSKNSSIFRLSVEAIVYRNGQSNEIVSRTIFQEDFSVVPKCCKTSFGHHLVALENNTRKGHGNSNYAINRLNLSSNECMKMVSDPDRFGIVVISSDNSSGFINANAGTTITNSEEAAVNPIYCITAKPTEQCTNANNFSANLMDSIDVTLPTLPTYPGSWDGSVPPPLIPCTSVNICPSNASGKSGDDQLMQWDGGKTIFNAKDVSTSTKLPSNCILHKNDIHCILSLVNVDSTDLVLVSGANTRRIRFYFPVEGDVVKQAGAGTLKHCKEKSCSGLASFVDNITDASFFGCSTQQTGLECGAQKFEIKGSDYSSRFFIFAPKATVNIKGTFLDVFEGVIWSKGIDITGTARAPIIPKTGVADVFILMGILPDESNTFNNSLDGHSYTDLFPWDMVARSTNRYRFFGN